MRLVCARQALCCRATSQNLFDSLVSPYSLGTRPWSGSSVSTFPARLLPGGPRRETNHFREVSKE